MGAITDPPGHPGYGPDVLTITNPSYAAYLKTPAGRIIAEQAAEIKALRDALLSIAANTCCDKCQEAALVARAALTPGEKG